MDFNFLPNLSLPGAAPLLPSVSATGLAVAFGWAVLLACASLAASRRLAWRVRWSLCALVIVWTLLPGPLSPAHWLGLAFQSPSLSSMGLGLVCLLRQAQAWPATATCGQRTLRVWMVLGIALGWVLLLDMLALLPMSFYAWGFSSAAFACMVALAALSWLIQGTLSAAWPLALLTLFALTRLPSGNVWDALLDPWLWLVLQLLAVLTLWRRWSRPRPPRSATRA